MSDVKVALVLGLGLALGFGLAILIARVSRRRRSVRRGAASSRSFLRRSLSRFALSRRRAVGLAELPVLFPDDDVTVVLPDDPPTTEPEEAPGSGFGASVGPDVQRSSRSSRRAWLRSEHGEFPLTGTANRIGRSHDNDIVIDDETVSRHHATIDYADDAWWLMPDVTGNGTFSNGALVPPGERMRITPGDVLQLGATITFSLVAGAADGERDLQLRFRAVGRTTPGGRQRNEDVHVAGDRFLAVADGVGGRAGGRVAARVAISAVASAPSEVPLEHAVRAAHERILLDAQGTVGLHGMATTLDLVRIVDRAGVWLLEGAHVGDGWVFFQDSQGTVALTRPDRLGPVLAEIDPQRAVALQGDPDYERLVAALGLSNGHLEVATWSRLAVAGQRVVVASDGLLEVLDAPSLMTVLDHHRHSPAEEVASVLLGRARASSDNATVVVADVEIEDPQPGAWQWPAVAGRGLWSEDLG